MLFNLSPLSSESIVGLSELGLAAGIPILVCPQHASSKFKEKIEACLQADFVESLRSFQQEGVSQLAFSEDLENSKFNWNRLFIILDDPNRPFPNPNTSVEQK